MSIKKDFLATYGSLVIETYDTIRKCVPSRKVVSAMTDPHMPLGTPHYGADYSRLGAALKRVSFITKRIIHA